MNMCRVTNGRGHFEHHDPKLFARNECRVTTRNEIIAWGDRLGLCLSSSKVERGLAVLTKHKVIFRTKGRFGKHRCRIFFRFHLNVIRELLDGEYNVTVDYRFSDKSMQPKALKEDPRINQISFRWTGMNYRNRKSADVQNTFQNDPKMHPNLSNFRPALVRDYLIRS